MWTQLEEVIVGLDGLSLTVDAVREALGEDDDEDGGGEEDGVREPRDPPPRGGLAFEEIDSSPRPTRVVVRPSRRRSRRRSSDAGPSGSVPSVMAPVLLFTDERLLEHDTGTWHPERAARLRSVLRGVDGAGLDDGVERRAPREASRDELAPGPSARTGRRARAVLRAGRRRARRGHDAWWVPPGRRRCWPRDQGSARWKPSTGARRRRRSARSGHPAITPRRGGRWGSACSTTWR